MQNHFTLVVDCQSKCLANLGSLPAARSSLDKKLGESGALLASVEAWSCGKANKKSGSAIFRYLVGAMADTPLLYGTYGELLQNFSKLMDEYLQFAVTNGDGPAATKFTTKALNKWVEGIMTAAAASGGRGRGRSHCRSRS